MFRSLRIPHFAEDTRQESKICCSGYRSNVYPIVKRGEAAGRDASNFVDEEKAFTGLAVFYRNALVHGARTNARHVFFPANEGGAPIT